MTNARPRGTDPFDQIQGLVDAVIAAIRRAHRGVVQWVSPAEASPAGDAPRDRPR